MKCRIVILKKREKHYVSPMINSASFLKAETSIHHIETLSQRKPRNNEASVARITLNTQIFISFFFKDFYYSSIISSQYYVIRYTYNMIQ